MPENKFYVVFRERGNAFGDTYKEYWDFSLNGFCVDIRGEDITNTFAIDEQLAIEVVSEYPESKIICYSFWMDYKYVPNLNKEQSNEASPVE